MSSALHPDGKLKPHDSVTNPSIQDDINHLIEARLQARRNFIKGSVGVTAAAMMGGSLLSGTPLDVFAHNYKHGDDDQYGDNESAPETTEIGFTSVAPSILPMADAVTVPAGYTARVLVSWGDSLTKAPHWNPSSPMDEATQNRCYGGHTDGMHYFPFPFTGRGGLASRRGLLVTNSEYVDPPLVNNVTPSTDYVTTALTLEMVRAQQAGHGVNVLEIEQEKKQSWGVNRRSKLNRRITGNTKTILSGPAAGNPMMQTQADPAGRFVLGTLNNCANGYTPWGTYLACEENFNGYFGTKNATLVPTTHENRYGVSRGGFGYRWHEADARFDIDLNRNEPNRFGWVVEIDPWNPESTPIKRTALGRFKHESAALSIDANNNMALYMGDDERNEYVYKFVCAQKYKKRDQRANRDMLDNGTLYVAKFNADGSGVWLPLVWGQNGLTPENGFANQGEVLIKARQAGDRLGATMMDRPEWAAVHPKTGEVYLTLTNNSRRGNTPVSTNKVDGSSTAGTSNPVVDAANPRPDNDYGHIISWHEDGNTVTATSFVWDIFVQCGDKNTSKALGTTYTKAEFDGQTLGYKGNINGDDYGAPDGLWFDKDGRLWIQTDQQGDAKGDWVNIGSNSMLCADPQTGETRRFLTAPPNAEVTGVITTPDGKSMFVGIQHPGEDWITSYTQNSTWPDNGANGSTTNATRGVAKPRSSVIVITKDDGGVIGT